LRGQHQLPDTLLDMRQMRIAEGLRHQQRHAQYELGLREVLGGTLMRRMRARMREVGGAIQKIDIAKQEHPFPRHEHVVEEDDAVHLLEARAERMVEMRAAEVEALAAQKSEPRRAARYRKADRKRTVRLGMARHARRVDADLVGERTQCREDARTAY